jgi:hypothetical protein
LSLAAVLALTISVFAGARLGIRYQRLRIHIVDAEVAIGVRVGRVGSLLELNDVVPVVRVDRVRIVAIKLVQLVARIELVDRVYIDIVLPIIIAVIAGIRLPQGFNPNIIGVRIPIGPVLIVVDFPAVRASTNVAIRVVRVRSVDELLEVFETVIVGIQFGIRWILRIQRRCDSNKGRPYH